MRLPRACADPEGRQGVRIPLKNHKIYGFLAILVRIPCKTTELKSQHSVLRHHRPASETPFKWRFAGGSMMARLKWHLDPLCPNQLKKKKKNKQIKTRKKSWTPSEKTFLIRACRESEKSVSPRVIHMNDVYTELYVLLSCQPRVTVT